MHNYKVVAQYSDKFITFQSDYLIALARTCLNTEIKSLCPWYYQSVVLKSEGFAWNNNLNFKKHVPDPQVL